MLERSEDRVKLLRNGFDQKQIEKIYLEQNKLRVVNPCVLFEPEDMEKMEDKLPAGCDAAMEYAQYLFAEVVNFCHISPFSEIASGTNHLNH